MGFYEATSGPCFPIDTNMRRRAPTAVQEQLSAYELGNLRIPNEIMSEARADRNVLYSAVREHSSDFCGLSGQNRKAYSAWERPVGG
jgi:hypothetical protein